MPLYNSFVSLFVPLLICPFIFIFYSVSIKFAAVKNLTGPQSKQQHSKFQIILREGFRSNGLNKSLIKQKEFTID